MRGNLIVSAALLVMLVSCANRTNTVPRAIAVFVPGVLEGSPSYQMMDSGVRLAADTAGVEVKTIEGGFDQAAWLSQLMSLASENQYGLIVTSNPAMSEVCTQVSSAYADQDFLVLDGSGLVGDSVSDVVYEHREQAFLVGYFAGLVTTSHELDRANSDLKVGMIAGQEYPQMIREIQPGFEIGLHTVNPDIELEFKVLGNWYDAEKAREYAMSLYDEGVDVILTIAGGANQGVISAARESEGYVLWFDSEGSHMAPGIVLAGAIIRQEDAAKEWVDKWINNDLNMGESRRVGVSDGYVDFPTESQLFKKHVPDSIQKQMREIVSQMKSGSLSLRSLDG